MAGPKSAAGEFLLLFPFILARLFKLFGKLGDFFIRWYQYCPVKNRIKTVGSRDAAFPSGDKNQKALHQWGYCQKW
jgi:hypothetical protein